jgi:hypothetical protein
VAALGIGVTVDGDIVGRVKERGVDLRAFADHPLQEAEVAAVAAADPVVSQMQMSPGLLRGVVGTGGITSSSGSPLPLKSTSSSPVEKPVTVRSLNRAMGARLAPQRLGRRSLLQQQVILFLPTGFAVSPGRGPCFGKEQESGSAQSKLMIQHRIFAERAGAGALRSLF